MDYKGYFKDKRITLMGLGLLGRGVGDARFLAQHCKELIVTDLKSEDELKTSLEQLQAYPNITYRLGEHDVVDFNNRDLIIKSAGVPLQNIFLETAEKNNIPISMSTALFAKFAPGTIIGITGTKGKSTTTHIIHHVLKMAGKNVVLGGNVQGVSTLELLPTITEDTIIVLELDSWQLQGFAAEHISPHIAVFTNFMEDHMNYYKGDTERYFLDKSAIFSNQTNEDFLVTSEDVLTCAEQYNAHIPSTCKIITNTETPATFTIPPSLPGSYNVQNCKLAIEALRLAGLSDEIIETHLQSIQTLPGRLEYRGEKNGTVFYNDTNATIPQATLASLQALKETDKEIILITGGTYKDVAVAEFATTLPKMVSKLVLLSGSGTDKLLEAGLDFPFTQHDSLQSAFDEATNELSENSVVLLSPAFSSFGMFTNEYDRGAQFNALVKNFIEL